VASLGLYGFELNLLRLYLIDSLSNLLTAFIHVVHFNIHFFRSFFGFLLGVQWSAERQENWQEDETICHAEDNDTEPHSEEGCEDVGLAWREDDNCKEG
jgi:hypothetical protein